MAPSVPCPGEEARDLSGAIACLVEEPGPPQVAVSSPPASPPVAAPPEPANPAAGLEGGPRRVRVADEDGRVLVARVYGPPEKGWVLLPDGRLARTNRLIDTSEPFRPMSSQELCDTLKDREFRDFSCKTTEHYVVFYQCSEEFAEASATLLESLYQGLLAKLPEKGIAVHPTEFPLVAVIYRSESDFRERRRIEPDIQAYYEIVSNRIYFYERRDRDLQDPRTAAMRQPQTVAHEGTHQVLQNIGVQPRLADWPVWLVEGLAELAASTTTNNGRWVGFSSVNPFHMATIHDLDDNRSLHARGQRMASSRIGRDRGASTARYLATRKDLTPTDYALAWALTHYLANQQTEKFVTYLKSMSRMEPLQPRAPDEHLADFQRVFGNDLPSLDRRVRKHLSGLPYPRPVYYAVMFEQPLPEGFVRRGTLVSQSPMVIREWFQQNLAPEGGPYLWQVMPFRSQAKAILFTEQWLRAQGLR